MKIQISYQSAQFLLTIMQTLILTEYCQTAAGPAWAHPPRPWQHPPWALRQSVKEKRIVECGRALEAYHSRPAWQERLSYPTRMTRKVVEMWNPDFVYLNPLLRFRLWVWVNLCHPHQIHAKTQATQDKKTHISATTATHHIKDIRAF